VYEPSSLVYVFYIICTYTLQYKFTYMCYVRVRHVYMYDRVRFNYVYVKTRESPNSLPILSEMYHARLRYLITYSIDW